MSKKKKTLEDVQSAFADFKSTLTSFGQSLDSEVGIAFDAEKSRVSLTKGQLVLKSMTAAAFISHVEFLSTLSREIGKATQTIPAFTQPVEVVSTTEQTTN